MLNNWLTSAARTAHVFFEPRPFLLPVLTMVLLIASFHPFNLWPLVFVALLPLYYFVNGMGLSFRKIFFGGFIVGVGFSLFLSYITVVQFHWLPEAHLFTLLVQLSFIPNCLFGGMLCGLAASTRWLRGPSVALNILIGATIYTATEMMLNLAFGGYFFATLAYAAAPFAPLLRFAALGGTFFVTFLVVLVSSVLAELCVALVGKYTHASVRQTLLSAVGIVAVFFIALGAQEWYLSAHQGPVTSSVEVNVIQVGNDKDVGFGAVSEDKFSFPTLESRLRTASTDTPDLVIYPFSPVEGALYAGKKELFNKDVLISSEQQIGDWLGSVAPASTTVMVWTTLYEDKQFNNVFQFWENRTKVSEYRKRILFPFLDYTPKWAQKIGLFSSPYDEVRGKPDQVIPLQGVNAGGLLCSEITRQDLARREAEVSSVIISAGSEAIFTDDEASQFSARAARLRAAENNIPVVRANILGPSLIIDPRGTVMASLERGELGVMRSSIPLRAPNPTLFSYFGNWTVTLLIAGIVLASWYVKKPRAFFLRRK